MRDISIVLKDVEQYIQQTKSQHYGGSSVQAIDAIEASGHSTGFIMGSIVKYAMRYGKKGSYAEQRKDLMKIVHYGLMALEEHDAKQGRVPLGELTITAGSSDTNRINSMISTEWE